MPDKEYISSHNQAGIAWHAFAARLGSAMVIAPEKSVKVMTAASQGTT